ncbi:phage tail assembly protein [Photobacterium damselae]|uniref:phage tail assembly protein n=1 Tax=Photobacterium damselae TaxID=38293 RepID=UPI000D668A70|nr:phage tail assembly protein [Photobacterium damselae]AWK84471.1 hypothetical protein BST98_20780 [Photobacterium damselae]
MAIMTFNLIHGFKAGEETHFEVALKELTSKDVIDAQMASEKVAVVEGKAVAYTSDVLMGLELMRRQVESIGTFKGPLSVKDLCRLHPDDLSALQKKSEELDNLLAEELATRGRS